MKTFERWTIDDIERLLHLDEQKRHPTLKAWLGSAQRLTPEEMASIEPYRALLEENVYFWTKYTTKFHIFCSNS